MDWNKESSHDDKQSPHVVPIESPPKKIEMPMAPVYPPITVAAKAAQRHYKMMMFINHSNCNLKQQTSLKIQIKTPLKMNISQNDSRHQRDGGGK
jgi:hypothetical protein